MTLDQNYVAGNTAARERLRQLLARLSDADLERPVDGGWSVASALVHLAFWDSRQLALLRKWQQIGVEPTPSDSDIINVAIQALSAAVPPRAAAELALAAAKAVDDEVEKVASDMAARIDQIGYGYVLRRSVHRGEHIDQIEQALSPSPAQQRRG
jgi:hypothetical protein